MKAEELLKIIKNEIKDYPIDYLKNKAEDDRYPDSATKRLAKYNSEIYDEIFSLKLNENFTVKDNIVENLKKDIDLYFEKYGGDDDLRNFTKYISLYLVLIAKKPLHPFSEDKTYDVQLLNGTYYCKGRIKYIHDENSLCRYCVCKNMGFWY